MSICQNQSKPNSYEERFYQETIHRHYGRGAIAGFTILPGFWHRRHGKSRPNDKLNIAGIGIGGVGGTNIANCSGENIVALCDVDWAYAKGTFEKYPECQDLQGLPEDVRRNVRPDRCGGDRHA